MVETLTGPVYSKFKRSVTKNFGKDLPKDIIFPGSRVFNTLICRWQQQNFRS